MLGVSILLAVAAWQPAAWSASRLAARHVAVRLGAGLVEETLVVDGQPMEVRRFVEAEVGMSFQKMELSERLFDDPCGQKSETGTTWPPDYPFPPPAFRRQDESDDADFYGFPRCVPPP